MNALSLDLRRRILNYSLNHSIRETARVFKASPNTVYLLAKRFAETGGVAPRATKAVHARAVSPEGEMFLQILLREDADMTLAEWCGRYERAHGARVGLSTMRNTLRRMGSSPIKKPFMTPPPATAPRTKDKACAKQLEAVKAEDRVCLDEMGSRLNLNLACGRSPAGERVCGETPPRPARPSAPPRS